MLKSQNGPFWVSIPLNKILEEAKMYPYTAVSLYSILIELSLILSVESRTDCGHTNRSVQVKRYIWQVSLFLKIAIILSID